MPVRDPFRLPTEIFRTPAKKRESSPTDEADDSPSEGEEAIRGAAGGAQRSLDRAARHLKMTDPLSVGVKDGDLAAVFNEDRELGVTGTKDLGGESLTGAVALARGGFLAEAKLADGETRNAAEVYFEPGYLKLKGDRTWMERGGGRTKAGAAISLTPDSFGLSGKLARADAAGNVKELSVGVSVDGEREVTDLGKTADGRRRIELDRSFGKGLKAGPGALGAMLGFSGKLGVSRDKSVLYRTSVTEDEARELVCERGGVVGFLRDKARAAGLKEDPVVVPDLSEPESLQVGDELIVSVSGGVSAAVLVGGLPFRVGAQGLVQGEFELAVKKHDDNRVEVVVTPSRVRGVQVRGLAPFVFDADASRTSAAALRQGFVFDLRDPEARAAYMSVLDGELPGGIQKDARERKTRVSVAEAALDDEALPGGVSRTYVEVLRAKQKRLGFGIGFALWHRSGPFIGFGHEKARTDEDALRVDYRGVRKTDTRGVDVRRQVLLSGNETRGVYARLHRSTNFDSDGEASVHFSGLDLELVMTDSKVRGRELDDEVIDELNSAFDLDIPHFGKKGAGEARRVDIKRELSLADLDDLTHSDAPELADLSERMRGTDAPVLRARAVQDFIQDEGLAAFGAIHRALGGGRGGLEMEAHASLYEHPERALDGLRLRYPEPFSTDDDKKSLTQRVKRVEEALAEVSDALEVLPDDPLVDDGKKMLVETKLHGVRAGMLELVAVDHLTRAERDTLIDRLDRGWTTGRQHRLIERLQAEGIG